MHPINYGTYQTASGQAVTGYVYRDHLTGGMQTADGTSVYRI